MPTIQVADKPTLDATKGLLENGTYGLSALKNAIASSGGGDGAVSNPRGIKYEGSVAYSGTLLDVSGKGKLFFAFMQMPHESSGSSTSAARSCTLKITVDGNVIYDKTATNNTGSGALCSGHGIVNMGFSDVPNLVDSNGGFRLYGGHQLGIYRILDTKPFSSQHEDMTFAPSNGTDGFRGIVLGSGQYIKFNNSLKIEVTFPAQAYSGYIHCAGIFYDLED